MTKAQIEARRGKLTASNVGCLMNGDNEGLLHLYHVLIGEAEEDDLSNYWPAFLGSRTESAQLDWHEMHGTVITRRGQVVVHPLFDWLAATLDGWLEQLACPIECKHVGGREPFEVTLNRYTPQMTCQMIVTGAQQCALSVIRGNDEPVIEYVALDPNYADELIFRAAQFMTCVETRTPPFAMPPAPPPVSEWQTYDMRANETWKRLAGSWLQVRGPAESAKEHEKALKALVPRDANKCWGCGIRITRDRAGRLSLRVHEKNNVE